MNLKRKLRLIVVGNGMASTKLLDELHQSSPNTYEIKVFSSEPYAGYNRIMLSPVLAGEKTIEDIVTCNYDWYQTRRIKLFSGTNMAVIEINRVKKQVVTQSGETFQYDRLVIATGSVPFMLPVEGIGLSGVVSFRDIADVERMIAASAEHSKAVVIGAGLLGLEAAMGLMQRGMDVTVINRADFPLNRQLDHEAGKLLQTKLEEKGLRFKMNSQTSRIIENSSRSGFVSHVEVDSNEHLEADLVVMAIGIQPNMELAQQAGLQCDKGILVSDTMQTFDPSIYALGECIQHRGDTFGLVAPLYDQAKVLANHLSEHGVAQYKTLTSATKLKVTGLNIFSVGDFEDKPKREYIYMRDAARGIYKKLVVTNNKLVGAVLIEDTQDANFYAELINTQADITNIRSKMMFGEALCRSFLDEDKADNKGEIAA